MKIKKVNEYFGGNENSFKHTEQNLNIQQVLNGLDMLRETNAVLYWKYFPNIYPNSKPSHYPYE